ncbi:MAG: hypothetical protein H2069_02280 [Legionella sp.]|nr:hypothetical protein [Legionella sp.]
MKEHIENSILYNYTIAQIHYEYLSLNSFDKLPNWKNIAEKFEKGSIDFRKHLLTIAKKVGNGNTLTAKKTWVTRLKATSLKKVIEEDQTQAQQDWGVYYNLTFKYLYSIFVDNQNKEHTAADKTNCRHRVSKTRKENFSEVVQAIRKYKTLRRSLKSLGLNPVLAFLRTPIGKVKLFLKRKDKFNRFAAEFKLFNPKAIKAGLLSDKRIEEICLALNVPLSILQKPLPAIHPYMLSFFEIWESILETVSIGLAANNVGILHQQNLQNYMLYIRLLLSSVAKTSEQKALISKLTYEDIYRSNYLLYENNPLTETKLMTLFHTLGFYFYKPIFKTKKDYDSCVIGLNAAPTDPIFAYFRLFFRKSVPPSEVTEYQLSTISTLLGKRLIIESPPKASKHLKKIPSQAAYSLPQKQITWAFSNNQSSVETLDPIKNLDISAEHNTEGSNAHVIESPSFLDYDFSALQFFASTTSDKDNCQKPILLEKSSILEGAPNQGLIDVHSPIEDKFLSQPYDEINDINLDGEEPIENIAYLFSQAAPL